MPPFLSFRTLGQPCMLEQTALREDCTPSPQAARILVACTRMTVQATETAEWVSDLAAVRKHCIQLPQAEALRFSATRH